MICEMQQYDTVLRLDLVCQKSARGYLHVPGMRSDCQNDPARWSRRRSLPQRQRSRQ